MEPESSAPTADRGQSADGAAQTETIRQAQSDENFTFINEYIQIDRLDGGASADFGDANLYYGDPSCDPTGGDPYDGTCDANLPASQLALCTSPTQTTSCRCTGDPLLDTDTCTDVEFIDWNELLTAGAGGMNASEAALETHRLLDEVKSDPDSFGNDSCVQTTNVLGKMDLTAAVVANNTEFAYLGLKRYDNNGDAGYSWIFTRDEPRLDPTLSGCSNGTPLVYDLTQGDVLVTGNFNPSSGADLTVRRVSAAGDGTTFRAGEVVKPDLMTAGGALVWEAIPGTTNVAAVNTTPTSAGVLEVIGGIDEAANRTDRGAIFGTSSPYAYGPNIVAEAGVDLDAFSGGGSLCGLAFYGSVVTQPSSSKTADLKDLLGPELFNFGSLSATASVSPSCDKEILYSVDSVSGPGVETTDPDSDSNITCNWTFTHVATEAQKTVNGDCAGSLTLAPGDPTGTWSASVSVSIGGGLSCDTTADAGDVDVYDALSVDVATTDYCDLSFDYEATPTGGSGSFAYEWTFDPNTVTPSTTTAASGSATVPTGDADYTATVTITDNRTDLTGDDACTATDFATAHPYAPIAVYLTPSDESLTCTSPPEDDTAFTSDAIAYTATASGGDGTYSYTWSGCSSLTASCTIDPSDSDFCAGQDISVTVDDGSTLCAAQASETERYTKVTLVNASDN